MNSKAYICTDIPACIKKISKNDKQANIALMKLFFRDNELAEKVFSFFETNNIHGTDIYKYLHFICKDDVELVKKTTNAFIEQNLKISNLKQRLQNREPGPFVIQRRKFSVE